MRKITNNCYVVLIWISVYSFSICQRPLFHQFNLEINPSMELKLIDALVKVHSVMV